jgi:hypothetical protein
MTRIRVSGTRVKTRGKRRARGVVLTFSLARPSVVRFQIRQEAPSCRVVGAFTVRGRSGLNRVRFFGRFRGEILAPGTYTIAASARRGRKTTSLGRITIVIGPSGANASSARRQPSVCRGRGDGRRDSAGGVLGKSGANGADPGAPAVAPKGSAIVAMTASSAAEAAAERAGHADPNGRDGQLLGVLPNPFEDAPSWLQPLLLLALGAALVFLLVAALPVAALRPTGAAMMVVHRRPELALAGATILGVVAVAAFVL